MTGGDLRAAVCLFVRDEARDIGEWLAYQIAIGFDAVFVYDNGSVDRTPEIVRAFGRQFDVRLIEWPDTSARSQLNCYTQCIEDHGAGFDWLAFIDSDELLVPHFGNVKQVLAERTDAPALAIGTAVFGSSGHLTRPPGLMIETFTWRRRGEVGAEVSMKSIVRPECAIRALDPHIFAIKCGAGLYRSAAGLTAWSEIRDGVVVPDAPTILFWPMQLNHYVTRSREEWDRKLARGYRDGMARAPDDFRRYDRAETEDGRALRFAPAVRAILDIMGAG
jgi:glycosyltransferase involved in cell wall biosynthesis